MKIYTTPNKSRGKNTCQYIMLHHTWSNSMSGTVSRFQNPIAKVSAHYVVWQDWSIAKFETDETILRHAGNGMRDNIIKMNNHAIGIEVVSDGKTYTDTQREAVNKLVIDLAMKHNIPKVNVIRHKDYTARKTDISDAFRNHKFKSRWAYKDFIFKNQKMYEISEKEKIKLILMYMNLWSMLYNMISTDEIKDAMAKVNEEFRKVGVKN